jgi:hypothetical protein
MKPIKQFILLAILLSTSFYTEAAESKLTFEPLYGMETSLVRYPEPARYVTRATYGARVLYGTTPLSGELEYTEAQSRKDYPGLDQKVFDKSQRASLGIRSTIALGSFLGFYLRVGGRASQGTTEVTTAGVTENIDNPLRVDPYAGTGLQLAFASNLALNAGVTMIRNQENKFDSQYTLGLTARFGRP